MGKLDSQQKILTAEHLAEVCGQNLATPMRSTRPASSFLPESSAKSQNSMHNDPNKGMVYVSYLPKSSCIFNRKLVPMFCCLFFSYDVKLLVSACKAKVAERTNSAWGAAVVNEKVLSNTAQAGSWGNIGACRNKATSNTGLGRSTFNSRNSMGKHSVAHNFVGGWKKFNKPWDNGKNVNGISTSSWSNPYVKNQVDSCGKGKEDIRGESTWRKAESFGKGFQEDTFGKAATSFANKPKAFGADVDPSLNKQDVGSFLNKQGDGYWKKQDGFSCSSRERPKTFEGGPSSGGRSGRGGGRGGRDQFGKGRGGGLGGRGQFGRGREEGRGGRDQFGKGRGSGRGGINQFGRGRPCVVGQSFGQGFGSWIKGRTDDNADQHGYLEKPITF